MQDREQRIREKEIKSRLWELRKLWNDYDPIGVVQNSEIDDDYEAYVGPHLGLFEPGASDESIYEHIKGEVTGHIGLTWSPYLEELTRAFVSRSREWLAERSRID